MDTRKKIADTILEAPFEVVLGGKLYKVQRPTLSTIIRVSSLIADMPHIPVNDNPGIDWVLKNAKECETLGDILTTFIIGHKAKPWYLKWLTPGYKDLKRKIINTTSPAEMSTALFNIVKMQELGFFLASINFLNGANLITQTTTIASGQ